MKGCEKIKFYKKRQNLTKEWLPFDKILENGIIVTSKAFIKIIKIKPINYDLKSNLEKEAVLNSYKLFLKSCDFDIQIIIQSNKEDLSKYFFYLNKISENKKNEKIKESLSRCGNLIYDINSKEECEEILSNFFVPNKKQSIEMEE